MTARRSQALSRELCNAAPIYVSEVRQSYRGDEKKPSGLGAEPAQLRASSLLYDMLDDIPTRSSWLKPRSREMFAPCSCSCYRMDLIARDESSGTLRGMRYIAGHVMGGEIVAAIIDALLGGAGSARGRSASFE